MVDGVTVYDSEGFILPDERWRNPGNAATSLTVYMKLGTLGSLWEAPVGGWSWSS